MIVELSATVNTLREGKAPRLDDMYSEFFNISDDQSLKFWTGIFNYLYTNRNIPK